MVSGLSADSPQGARSPNPNPSAALPLRYGTSTYRYYVIGRTACLAWMHVPCSVVVHTVGGWQANQLVMSTNDVISVYVRSVSYLLVG